MQTHKFDTPKKHAHLHAWRAKPATPEEWIEHWKQEGGIWIPDSHGPRPVFLQVSRISKTGSPISARADYVVESKNSKPFYVKFAKDERVFSPLSYPTLIIPHGMLRQAWWLLSAN